MSKRFLALTFVLPILILIDGATPASAQEATAAFSPSCSTPPSGPMPVHYDHVVIVMLENHEYSSVIGNMKLMPFLNLLALTYAHAGEYWADSHPSLPNYFMLTTGQKLVDVDHSPTVTADNIVRHLIAAEKTWKAYAEGLPSVGYTGGDTGAYVEHHNPLSYFSDVRNSPSQQKNLVPFSQFETDLLNDTLPNYSFIVPDSHDDGEECPPGMKTCTDADKLANVDVWLENNIWPVVRNSEFSQPGSVLLVITFDEALPTDKLFHGGHVAWIVAGPNVKRGYTSDACYMHESTLRMISEALGLTTFPGAAAKASNMEEFFTASPAGTPPDTQ